MICTNSKVLDWIDELETTVLKWEGTSLGLHKYGGSQFNYLGKEFAHLHSNGLLDILFNQKLKAALLNEGRVANHHVFAKSGWISFHLRTANDVDYAKDLLALAFKLIR